MLDLRMVDSVVDEDTMVACRSCYWGTFANEHRMTQHDNTCPNKRKFWYCDYEHMSVWTTAIYKKKVGSTKGSAGTPKQRTRYCMETMAVGM